MKRESNIECDCSDDIGPQIMEYRPNSNPENSAGIRSELPILSLTEQYALTRCINLWDRPKYGTYITKEACLRYFVILYWSHGLHSAPNALNETGYFFACKT